MNPRTFSKTILCVAIAAALPNLAAAATNDWTGGAQPPDGAWSNPGNWSLPNAPANGEDVNLVSVGVDQIVTYDTTVVDTEFNSLLVKGADGNVIELSQEAGTSLSATGLTVDGGGTPGGNGLYTLQSGAVLDSGNTVIGLAGVGSFNHISGDHISGPLVLGQQVNSSGAYNLFDGSLRVDGHGIVGDAGLGTFTQVGGTNTIANLTLGQVLGGQGTYALSGGTLQTGTLAPGSGGSIIVGNQGAGFFSQTNADGDSMVNIKYDPTDVTNDPGNPGDTSPTGATGFLFIGRQNDGLGGPGGTGAYAMSDVGTGFGLTLNVDKGIQIGGTDRSGTSSGGALLCEGAGPACDGQFTQDAGTVNAGSVQLGFQGGKGSYILNAGNLNTGLIDVGNTGYEDNRFIQNGGANQAGNVFIANGITSLGAYELHGGDLTTKATWVSAFGEGTFIQDGGTHTTSELQVAQDFGGLGSYQLSAGTLQVDGSAYAGGGVASAPDGAAIGTIEQSGGTANIVGDLALGYITHGDGTYKLSGDPATVTLNVGGSTLVGGGNSLVSGDPGGNGTFEQKGGTYTVGADLVVGQAGTLGGGQGKYTLTDGSLSVGNTTWVGQGGLASGDGTFDQSGGSHTTSSLTVSGSGASTYNLSGGTLTTDFTVVSDGAFAKFNQTGGTHTAGFLNTGIVAFSNGEYNLSAGDLSVRGNLNAGGSNATGVYNQTGGNVVVNSEGAGVGMFIGGVGGGGGSGTYNLSETAGPATVLVKGDANIGTDGKGTFKQSGGSVAAETVSLGQNSVGDGSYILGGGTSKLTATGLVVGGQGTGNFDQSGGTVSVFNPAGTVYIGKEAGSTGTYTLSGGSLKVETNEEKVGASGTGHFNQTGGTHTFTGTLFLGDQIGGKGEYTLDGGNVQGGSIALGDSGGQGSFIQSNGSSVFISELFLARQNSSGQGFYQLKGGDLTIKEGGRELVGVNGAGIFEQTGGTNSVAGGTLSLGENAGSSGTYTMNGVKLETDLLRIGNEGTGTFVHGTGDIDIVKSVVLAESAGSSGNYQLEGGTLKAASTSVGRAGTGEFTQTGGSQTVTDILHVGEVAGSKGTYELSGGSLAANMELIGEQAQAEGHFIQTGGTNDVNTLGVGWKGDGSYQLSGTGQLSASSESIGSYDGSVGQFDQSGGSNTVTNGLNVGGELGATGQGTYRLTGGDLAVGGSTIVGNQGKGSFIQSDAAGPSSVVANKNLHLGELAGSSGNYVLDGATSSLKVTGANQNETVGVGGAGEFTQNGGSHSVEGVLSVGGQASGQGQFHLNGGTLTVGTATTPGLAYVGEYGIGAFDQSGAASATVNGNLSLGGQAGSQGTYALNGGSLDVLGTGPAGGNLAVGDKGQGALNLNGGDLTATVEDIGRTGTGSLTQKTGSTNQADSVTLGALAGGKGTYQLDGGTLTTNNLSVGDAGQGSFNQAGGETKVTNDVVVAKNAGSAGSSYNLSGGTLSAANLDVKAGGTFNYSGGSLGLDSGAGTWTNDGQANIHAATPQGNLTVNANVVNDGNFKVTDTKVDYAAGTFTNNGAYISASSTSSFTDLTVTNTGYLQGGGDTFIVKGGFENHSTQDQLWNTLNSKLVFTATNHDFSLAGTDQGIYGFFGNFTWGALDLTQLGSQYTLNLTDGNTGNGSTALYVRYLLFTTIDELVAQLSGVGSTDFVGNVYYDLRSNPRLEGKTYTLARGLLLPGYFVPEPSTWLLMLSGSMAVLVTRRRKAQDPA